MAPGSGHTKKQMPQPVQPDTGVVGRVIAVAIQLVRQQQDLGRAGLHAQPATFALFGVQLDLATVGFVWSCHLQGSSRLRVRARA